MKKIVLLFLVLTACSVSPKNVDKPVESAQPTPAEIAAKISEQEKEKNQFLNAQAFLDTAKYEQSLMLFKEFQGLHKQSIYSWAAKMGEARSLEGLHRWTEANEIYRNLMTSTIKENPEIAAQALYRTSYCYEALGEEIKAVAALLDAYKKQTLLPIEVGRAEVPARLAMLYSKANNEAESNKYLNLAQKGLQSISGNKDITPEVLAKTHFEMGSVSTDQISIDNFSQAIAGQKAVQKYLFRAVSMQLDPWSQESANKIKKNYRDLWNLIMTMPGVDGVDAESIARNKKNKQTKMAAEFMELLENAELNRPLEDSKTPEIEAGVFAYIEELKKQSSSVMYASKELMPLTEASKERKKSDTKENSSLTLPKAKQDTSLQDAPKVTPSEDPNL